MEEQSRKPKNQQSIDSDDPGDVRTFRRLSLIVVAIGAVGVIGMAALTIGVISWLTNKTNEMKDTADNITQQMLPEASALNLDSYITNNQVNGDKLKDTFNALPDQLQHAWLKQFNSQIEDLKAQAGVPADTINTLTSLYDTLKEQAQ